MGHFLHLYPYCRQPTNHNPKLTPNQRTLTAVMALRRELLSFPGKKLTQSDHLWLPYSSSGTCPGEGEVIYFFCGAKGSFWIQLLQILLEKEQPLGVKEFQLAPRGKGPSVYRVPETCPDSDVWVCIFSEPMCLQIKLMHFTLDFISNKNDTGEMSQQCACPKSMRTLLQYLGPT